MPVLSVKSLPSSDNGRHMVRLNAKHRSGTRRFGIVSLRNVNNNQSVLTLVLGHDDIKNIYMPFDIRTALGIEKGGSLEFDLREVGLIGRLRWILCSPDPAVHLPAWLAALSVALGFVGILVAVIR